jgi:hypothetical protein
MDTEERGRRMDRVIARFKSEAAFQQDLLANPARALASEGIDIPPGTDVRALVNTNGELLILSRGPLGELSDNELDKVAGGGEGSWTVLGSYRVWEANRKQILYPENFLTPE